MANFSTKPRGYVKTGKVSDKHKIDILEALMDLRVTRKSPTKTINAKIRKLANE